MFQINDSFKDKSNGEFGNTKRVLEGATLKY